MNNCNTNPGTPVTPTHRTSLATNPNQWPVSLKPERRRARPRAARALLFPDSTPNEQTVVQQDDTVSPDEPVNNGNHGKRDASLFVIEHRSKRTAYSTARGGLSLKERADSVCQELGLGADSSHSPTINGMTFSVCATRLRTDGKPFFVLKVAAEHTIGDIMVILYVLTKVYKQDYGGLFVDHEYVKRVIARDPCLSSGCWEMDDLHSKVSQYMHMHSL